MKLLFSSFFIFYLNLNLLYGDDVTSNLSQQDILFYTTLLLTVSMVGLAFSLFKRMNDSNKYLEQKNIEFYYNKERLDLALKFANLGSWDVDFQKNQIVVNQQWISVSGWDLELDNEGVISREDWLKTIHPDEHERVLKYGADYKNGLIEEYNLEYRGVTKDDEEIWLLSTGAVVERDKENKPIRMVGIVRDITKDKIYQESLKLAKTQAEEAMRMKSEFLANMSHEIRTPLNAIIGFIDLLKEQETNEERLDYINTVSTSSKNLVGIINDILDFSKIESGKLSIEHIDFDTQKEFNMPKKLFQAKADEKDIQLHTFFKEVPPYLKSDILRIKQIINNLFSNAIKFTPNGKNITLSVEYKENELHVAVKDEGIGIKPDKLQSIFEAFSQEDVSTTRKYGGTGLGLSISSRLVKLLGGELKVESTLGEGSTFYFKIPVETGKATEKETKSVVTLDHLKDKKILLVEDIDTNQKIMKVLIEKAGMQMDIADDGLQAIEKYKVNKYDAILMDENMPVMNGIEATSEIINYEKENELEHTPIVALTGNAVEGDRERFIAAGMDEYLNKPIDRARLYEVLSSFFKG